MADHTYEVGVTKTTGAAAGPIVSIIPGTLGAGIRMPSIREIGIFSVTGIAAEVGLGLPAAIGTGGASVVSTVQALDQPDPVGHTTVASTFTTLQPTAPTNFYRRAELQPVVGAGVIWVWDRDEWRLWSGATIPHLVIWQLSALAVTYDVYVKVAE